MNKKWTKEEITWEMRTYLETHGCNGKRRDRETDFLFLVPPPEVFPQAK